MKQWIKQENNHCLYISFDKEIGNYNCIVCGLTRFQYHLVEDIDGRVNTRVVTECELDKAL